ncbi:restriction endonuclease subunit S [[Haemophilus] felis]|nr:restriction endonuclease subunit S [[Haemophilus] felis]
MTAQPHLTLTLVKKIPIFNPSNEFKDKVSALFKSSIYKREQAKTTYLLAEALLLEKLGLQHFQVPEQAVNLKSFSASFGLSGRLDAEFYQVKYDNLMFHLTQSDNALLKDLVKIKKSIEPGSLAYDEEGLPFIRVSDYDKFQISTPAKYLSDKFCAENKNLLDSLKPEKGTILFSKDGTIGIAHLLTENLNAVTSSAILHLNVKDKRVLPEYLTLVLNSRAVQMQAERDVGGSIIPHWRIDEIENVVIPIIPIETQNQITQLIQQFNHLREESKQLLEKAKLAVELAIEKNEAFALKTLL